LRRAGALAALLLVVTTSFAAPTGKKAHKPKAAPEAVASRQVTFSGFQPLADGTGRVFVHLTEKPEFQVSSDGNRVVVHLPNTGVGVRNNRNPLDVSQFNVLLLKAQLVPRGSDVDLVLQLRKPAQLEVTIVETPADGVSLHVKIPSA
jgi:hypothetical protein